MKKSTAFLLAALLVLVLALPSCAPAQITYVDKLYMRDYSTPTQSGYDFIQLHSNGFFNSCSVMPDTLQTAAEIYENTCKQFLVLVPGAMGLPAEPGNYAIAGDVITLNYGRASDYLQVSGTYSADKLVITQPDGTVQTYTPYP